MKEMNPLKYPIGVQNFPSMRENGWLYVDKTAYIHELVNDATPFAFLSRPRRFGKSLLISTLEAYFKGERDLFRGLAIDRLEPEPWNEYAVLHIDFNKQIYADDSNLENLLNYQLST